MVPNGDNGYDGPDDGSDLTADEAAVARDAAADAQVSDTGIVEGSLSDIIEYTAEQRREMKMDAAKRAIEKLEALKRSVESEDTKSYTSEKKEEKKIEIDDISTIVYEGQTPGVKLINNLIFDRSFVSHEGETRYFKIIGENTPLFSMMVFDDNSTVNYYNFANHTWSTSEKRLSRKAVKNGVYSNYIKFPKDGTRVNTYTIHLFAEAGAKHIPFEGVNDPDTGAVDINNSRGSNSNLLIKTIKQGVAKTLTLSCIAPSRSSAATDTKDGAISSGTSLVMDTSYLTKGIRVGDIISGTNIVSGTQVTAVNVGDVADTYTMSAAPSGTVSNGATLTFTGPWTTMTPRAVKSNATGDSGSTSGADTYSLTMGRSYPKTSFSITLTATSGRTISVLRNPTTDDLCAFRTVTIGSAGKAISGEDTSSNSLFYRWPVSNIAGLNNRMILDPSNTTGANVTYNSRISNYIESISHTVETIDEDGAINTSTKTIINQELSGVDGGINTRTKTFDIVTAQAGDLIFDNQQADALKDDTNVRIIAYGRSNIKQMTFGTDVVVSNTKCTLTSISTTVNDASATGSASLSDFDVSSTTGISVGAAVSGPNISTTNGIPKVTAISSSNITVSPTGHLLQNGQSVTFTGSSNIVTITGDIEIKNMGIEDTTLFFDVERFLHCD